MFKRIVVLLGALLFLGASAFASCPNPGYKFSGVANPAIGQKASIPSGPPSGCGSTNYMLRASLTQAGSTANAVPLVIRSGACGTGTIWFATSLSVTSTTYNVDRYESITQPLQITMPTGNVCIEFTEAAAGVAQTVYFEATAQ